MGRKVTLPSGAELDIQLRPFAESRALYQAFLEEAKSLKLDPAAEVDVNMWKDLACLALSSKRVEEAIWVCFKGCLYKKIQISLDTFEPEEAREDYFTVMMEVARENVLPFTKSLFVQYAAVLGQLKGVLNPQSSSSPKETPSSSTT